MTPDTAPEAITQADREAAAALVVPHGRWPGFPADFRSGRADANELTQSFARHRRLTAHSAGEGLREGWRLVPVEADDAMATAAAAELQRQTAYLGWEPTAIWAAMLGAAPPSTPTPPSDAGSTTLLPCPKCGGVGRLRMSSDGDAEWVECEACGYNGGVALSAGLAIKSWNTHPYKDRGVGSAARLSGKTANCRHHVHVDDSLAFADQISEQHRLRAKAAEAKLRLIVDTLIDKGESWYSYANRLRAIAWGFTTSSPDAYR